MLRFEDNPPILPEGIASVSELQGEWWVAHTKARNEKSLACDLLDRNVDYFLPLIEKVKFSGGRKRRLMLPLFSSYVFFCGGAEQRYEVLATDRVCQVIRVLHREQFVGELLAIQQAINSKVHLDLHPLAAVGKRCRVIAGPLQGVVGSVIRLDNRARLVLWVSMLGRGASLEIDADLLETAE